MKLSEEQVIIKLQALRNTFSYSQGKLIAEFKFLNFSEAFCFLTRLALIASRLDHYPSLLLEENKVKISLYSSMHQGITEKDFQLASQILLIN